VDEWGINFYQFSKTPMDVPPGTQMSLVLAFNPSLQANASTPFPCGVSSIVPYPDEPVCDYRLYGIQYKDGLPIYDPPTSSYTPGCCPEGIYTPVSRVDCGCTDNKEESPFRLQASPSFSALTTSHTFSIFTVGGVITDPSIDPITGEPANCTNMGIDSIRLYINPAVAGAITGALINGVVAPTTVFGSDATQTWVEFQGIALSTQSLGTTIPFDIITSQPVSHLCSYNSWGTSACEYVLYGKFSPAQLDYSCCAQGYSEPTGLTEPAECCDSNALHSPYAVSHSVFMTSGSASDTILVLDVNAAACSTLDPANAGCCDSDLKAVFISTPDPRVFTSIVSNPQPPNFLWEEVSGGVNITANFGKETSYTLTITANGPLDLTQLCGGNLEGCIYKLYGGYRVVDPYACCASSVSIQSP
jgi:hypothetical protein